MRSAICETNEMHMLKKVKDVFDDNLHFLTSGVVRRSSLQLFLQRFIWLLNILDVSFHDVEYCLGYVTFIIRVHDFRITDYLYAVCFHMFLWNHASSSSACYLGVRIAHSSRWSHLTYGSTIFSLVWEVHMSITRVARYNVHFFDRRLYFDWRTFFL